MNNNVTKAMVLRLLVSKAAGLESWIGQKVLKSPDVTNLIQVQQYRTRAFITLLTCVLSANNIWHIHLSISVDKQGSTALDTDSNKEVC